MKRDATTGHIFWFQEAEKKMFLVICAVLMEHGMFKYNQKARDPKTRTVYVLGIANHP